MGILSGIIFHKIKHGFIDTFVNCASRVIFTVEAGLCYKGKNLVVSQSNTCSVNTQFNQCKESSRKRHHGLWPTMSLIESIQKYDLEGVKAALQSGADVNTRDEDEYGWPPLIWAVTKNCKNCRNCKHQNTVISLLLSSPNIDVKVVVVLSVVSCMHASKI